MFNVFVNFICMCNSIYSSAKEYYEDKANVEEFLDETGSERLKRVMGHFKADFKALLFTPRDYEKEL